VEVVAVFVVRNEAVKIAKNVYNWEIENHINRTKDHLVIIAVCLR
jgi:hypothetical protein